MAELWLKLSKSTFGWVVHGIKGANTIIDMLLVASEALFGFLLGQKTFYHGRKPKSTETITLLLKKPSI